MVWDGDQLLYERHTGPSLTDTGPNADNLVYVHGPKIDEPFGMIRYGEPLAIHYNWRGLPAFATDTLGHNPTCVPPNFTNCVNVNWPGGNWGARLQSTVYDTTAWYGSLAVTHRDATGDLYRRNRYYDPSSGQFTQADPIGLAGGLNLYGFAEGDPVNYSDPFGLCLTDGRGAEDRECRAVIQLLQRLAGARGVSPHARDELLSAASAFEQWKGDVELYSSPGYAQVGSYVGGRTNNDARVVRLNRAQGGVDLGMSAWHEAQHMSTGGGLGDESGSTSLSVVIYSAQNRVFIGLTERMRTLAPLTQWFLSEQARRGFIRR